MTLTPGDGPSRASGSNPSWRERRARTRPSARRYAPIGALERMLSGLRCLEHFERLGPARRWPRRRGRTPARCQSRGLYGCAASRGPSLAKKIV